MAEAGGGAPFLLCAGCQRRIAAAEVASQLPRLYHGHYTVAEAQCGACTGGACHVVVPAKLPLRLVSRVVLFDLAWRSGTAFQRIRDVGDAVRAAWPLFFGRQRRMPKTVSNSVSASITTDPAMFQRHSTENLWAVKDPTADFAAYLEDDAARLQALEEEAAAQVPGAAERNAEFRRQRQQQLEDRQGRATPLDSRPARLSPRLQMLESAQFLVLATPRHREAAAEAPPPADLLWQFHRQYLRAYFRLCGVASPDGPPGADGADRLPPPRGALPPAGWLVPDVDVWAEAEAADGPPPAKRPRREEAEDAADANERLLAALERCAARTEGCAAECPSPYARRWPLPRCAAQKAERFARWPLPPDFGRRVQLRLRATANPDEQMHQSLYLQKWRAWVRSGAGACAVPELPPEVAGKAAAPVEERAGAIVSDPWAGGADPRRALLVDHLVLCEEVEDCRDCPRRAAYLGRARLLKAVYDQHRREEAWPP
eukprot:EG_transcript_9630